MRRGLGPRAVRRFMAAAGVLALRLRLAEGRRRSTAERHPMADGDLMGADRTAVAEGILRWTERTAVAEGTSRWVDRMAVAADRMAVAADRMAAAVIMAEIASHARLINRGGL